MADNITAEEQALNDIKNFKSNVETTLGGLDDKYVQREAFDAALARITERAKESDETAQLASTPNLYFGSEYVAHQVAAKFIQTYKPLQEAIADRGSDELKRFVDGSAKFADQAKSNTPEAMNVAYDNAISKLVTQFGTARQVHDAPRNVQYKLELINANETGRAKFIGEGQTDTNAVNHSFTKTVLEPKKLGDHVPVTQELLLQSPVALAQEIAVEGARRLARAEDYVTFAGTGANDADNGGITGYANLAGINEISFSEADMLAGTKTGNKAVLADLRDMQAAVHESADDASSWYMHRSDWYSFLKMIDEDGRPLVRPDFESGPAGTMLGRNITLVQALPVGTFLYGDLRMAGVLAVGPYSTVAQSSDYRFLDDVVVIKFREMFDFKVRHPSLVSRGEIARGS